MYIKTLYIYDANIRVYQITLIKTLTYRDN